MRFINSPLNFVPNLILKKRNPSKIRFQIVNHAHFCDDCLASLTLRLNWVENWERSCIVSAASLGGCLSVLSTRVLSCAYRTLGCRSRVTEPKLFVTSQTKRAHPIQNWDRIKTNLSSREPSVLSKLNSDFSTFFHQFLCPFPANCSENSKV